LRELMLIPADECHEINRLLPRRVCGGNRRLVGIGRERD
jgi:hypothetical protein